MSAPPLDSLAFSLLQGARIVAQVFDGKSLAEGLLERVPAAARPAVQDLAYSTLRQYGRFDFVLARLLSRPLKNLQIRALLLLALHRLEQRPETAHTTVDQAVSAATDIAGGRFKGLVNGVLRNFLRNERALLSAADADEVAAAKHPEWWLRRLQKAYPEHWFGIIEAGNQTPPMALRVNRRAIDRETYRQRLADEGIVAVSRGDQGLLLSHPVPIDRLPGFGDGLVSVQDLGAQHAAEILAPQPGARVLDACAAPGGKTAHLLEMADIDLLALDLKPARCRRIEENLSRLRLRAQVRQADCANLPSWWDGRLFDAVLADVPCSASGVVRRHPDAKWLRRPDDILSFARAQSAILEQLWQVVRPGGTLLYVTCSVFPEENELQMARFRAMVPGAMLRHEERWLPDLDHDGFYFCLVDKTV